MPQMYRPIASTVQSWQIALGCLQDNEMGNSDMLLHSSWRGFMIDMLRIGVELSCHRTKKGAVNHMYVP